MLARILFFLAAAAATITAAVLAGLLTAVIGMFAHLPDATLITLIVGAVTAASGATVALASMAASLFFNPPMPPSPHRRRIRRHTTGPKTANQDH